MKLRKKIGLALGAGAARGLAHIGVLQVLEENNIPIDIVTGTSMGAIIGGLYAGGTDLNFIEDYVARMDISRFLDFSLKNGGIVKGKRIERLLLIFTGNKSIEQLELPFACAAVEITTGEVVNFTSGGLYEAIRASISMPGVFAPYEIDGRLYMDGGPLERVPIDSARALGADIVIGIDVSWRGQKLARPKNAIQSMQSALSIAGWEIAQVNNRKADLIIAPNVFEINPFSTKESGDCIEAGRVAVRKALPQIQALLHEEAQ